MDWPALSALSSAEKQAVVAVSRPQSFIRGEIVFHEGDRSDSVHLISTGHFAVQVSTPDGERATLNVLGPGGWFGELPVPDEPDPTERSATVLALDEASTLVLTLPAFQDLCRRHAAMERLVQSLMASRIRDLSTQLLQALYLPLDRRLCSRLLDLVAVYGGATTTVLPLTQEQIADLVGGTRSSVNQALQRLVADGVVELGRGRVVVIDPDGLEHRAGH